MWDKPEIMLWLADLLYALAAILLLYAILFLVIHLPIFPLREIKVNGSLQHITKEQVQYIVNRELTGNFFTLDLKRTRQAFEKLPWVRKVNVRRKWPDLLEVTLEEHVALARWGNMALVDTHGELFDGAQDGDLPVFVGPADSMEEMARNYQDLSRIVAPAGLVIGQLAMNSRRAWQLRFKNGLIAEAGREQVPLRLARFVGAYRNLTERFAGPLTYVDLRYANGFAVRVTGLSTRAGAGHAPEKKAA